MTTFNLMHCQPDPLKFAQWAARQRLLPPGGDTGYALHAALHAVFGARVPKPFYHRDERAGLVAYTQSTEEELREAVAICPAPDLVDALGLERGPQRPGLGVKPFPLQWQAGRMIGFELRVRPMRRNTSRDNKHSVERDAYRVEDERREELKKLSREETYMHWLKEQLARDGAAKLEDARMTRYQLTSVIRRTQADPQNNEGRKPRTILGPDATFTGHLCVKDTEAFARLLMRGVGRHRSFGFGMLMLRPASIA